MKRPADQAKLLFFYLLRSSAAALATESPSLSHSAAASARMQTHEGHICLRLARRTDVPSIQKCNLATLPENYNANFYNSHLRQWPDLAIVAEHVTSKQPSSSPTRLPFHKTSPFGRSNGNKNSDPKIIAYVLGKVEEKVTPPMLVSSFDSTSDFSPEDRKALWAQMQPQQNDRQLLGHVTSLAVLEDYRRHGLAGALMQQLHFHLAQNYQVGGCGLHVRKSNVAATKLYEKDGYIVDNLIPSYYQDGEDAYFMRKPLEALSEPTRQRGSRVRPWEVGPLQLRLPREEAFRRPLDLEEKDRQEELASPHPVEPQILTGM